MGYIKRILSTLFRKIRGYNWQKLWDIFHKKYGKNLAKTMGYIGLRL